MTQSPQRSDREMMWISATIGNVGGTTVLVVLTGLPGAILSLIVFSAFALSTWKESKFAAVVCVVVNIATTLVWDWFSGQTPWGGFLWFLH